MSCPFGEPGAYQTPGLGVGSWRAQQGKCTLGSGGCRLHQLAENNVENKAKGGRQSQKRKELRSGSVCFSY